MVECLDRLILVEHLIQIDPFLLFFVRVMVEDFIFGGDIWEQISIRKGSQWKKTLICISSMPQFWTRWEIRKREEDER
jgi:hypothetical protein